MARKKSFFKRVKIGSKRRTKKGKFKRIKLIVLFLFVLVVVPGIIGGIWFYENVYSQVPDIAEIKDAEFSQTSVITDRNGEILYELFEENRKYIPYEEISSNMVEAIVATEDQNFWTNPGVDIHGIARAGAYEILYPNKPMQGGSTITQQLIKNLLLTRQKLITRKLKEIILAYQIDDYLKQELTSKYGDNLNDEELQVKIKERILELYLNYIFFGNNAYGIEAASQEYFDKPAKDLDVLEASLLAGIPRAPSTYNPYTNKEYAIGNVIVTDSDGNEIEYNNDIKQVFQTKVRENLEERTFIGQDNANRLISFFTEQSDVKLQVGEETYDVEYQIGRKDIVLFRMYAVGYLDAQELVDYFIEGMFFQVTERSDNIKAPHFVMWVIKKLRKEYGEEMLRKGGLEIRTTLDYEMQKKAKQAMEKNLEENIETYGGTNTAMVYLDSIKGDVLTYVGGIDYFDEEIDGNVDMIQSKRQPGSIIKPLLYALGFIETDLTLDSPTYDIPFKIGDQEPNNVDGSFMGLIPVKNALPYSRNISAIKMFFRVGGERIFVNFLESLGIEGLNKDSSYGYSIGLGAAEMTMLDIANAYMHLSAPDVPGEINPILNIRNSDGALLYDKKVEKQEKVIPSGVSYLLRDILSDLDNFPSSWRNNFAYKDYRLARKSGTTNMKVEDESFARDGWTVVYTPSRVIISWAGNTDGSPLKQGAYGGWLNSDNWKGFMQRLEDDGYQDFQDLEMPMSSVRQLNISKLTGKRPNNTPISFVKNTLGYINNLPGEEQDGIIKNIQIDELCNGKVSENTPESAIQRAYVIDPISFLPGDRDYDEIIERWKSKGLAKHSEKIGQKLFLKEPEQECKGRKLLGEDKLDFKILSNINSVTKEFSVWYQAIGVNGIDEVNVYFEGTLIKQMDDISREQVYDVMKVSIPSNISSDSGSLRFEIVDEEGNIYNTDQKVNIIQDSNSGPYIREDGTYISKIGDSYQITLLFDDDDSVLSQGQILQDGDVVHEFTSHWTNFQVDSLEGLEYIVTDNFGNETEGKIQNN